MTAVVGARPAAGQFSAHAKSLVTGFSFLDGIQKRNSDIANAPDLPEADTDADLSIPAVPQQNANAASGSQLSAHAFGKAKPGVVKAFLQLSAGGGGNSFQNFSVAVEGTGEAIAGWRDTALFSSAAVSIGTKITVRAPLIVDGAFFAGSTASAPIPERVNDLGSIGTAGDTISVINSSTDARFVETSHVGPELPGSYTLGYADVRGIVTPGIDSHLEKLNDVEFAGPNTSIPVEFTFTNGQPYIIGFELAIFGNVLAERDNLALFEANFADTLLWGGIESVRDATTGAPIDDWTITSDSGFDYSKPANIPEPSTAALLVIGCVVGLVAHRR